MGKDTTQKLNKYIKEDRPSRFNSFVRKRAIDVYSIAHYMIKFVSDLRQGVVFLLLPRYIN
jgi:hypothetical protein